MPEKNKHERGQTNLVLISNCVTVKPFKHQCVVKTHLSVICLYFDFILG